MTKATNYSTHSILCEQYKEAKHAEDELDILPESKRSKLIVHTFYSYLSAWLWAKKSYPEAKIYRRNWSEYFIIA